MKHFRLLFLVLALLLTVGIQAQDITVKGVVTDETSEPIVGATIRVGNTASGTVTDVDGNFSV